MISLRGLNGLRSAPILDAEEIKYLLEELLIKMECADWFTVGIMAPSQDCAILVIKEIEKFFNWKAMSIFTKAEEPGPVFLKAN